VSHYVEPGSEIDQEALERATSVYLVDRTIPMLPEKLSNEVCSLRPHEDKLAFSIIMEVTPHGEVKDYDIRETVIHSMQRLTTTAPRTTSTAATRTTRLPLRWSRPTVWPRPSRKSASERGPSISAPTR
jgi:RNAse R (EC 3.1.-.-)